MPMRLQSRKKDRVRENKLGIDKHHKATIKTKLLSEIFLGTRNYQGPCCNYVRVFSIFMNSEYINIKLFYVAVEATNTETKKM